MVDYGGLSLTHWVMVSAGRGSTAPAREWGQGSFREGVPAPEGAAVTLYIRLGPVWSDLDDLQFANTFYVIPQFCWSNYSD